MKGSAISGPVAKECVCFLALSYYIHFFELTSLGRSMAAYCLERRHSRLNHGFGFSVSVLCINTSLWIWCTTKHYFNGSKQTIDERWLKLWVQLQSRCCGRCRFVFVFWLDLHTEKFDLGSIWELCSRRWEGRGSQRRWGFEFKDWRWRLIRPRTFNRFRFQTSLCKSWLWFYGSRLGFKRQGRVERSRTL